MEIKLRNPRNENASVKKNTVRNPRSRRTIGAFVLGLFLLSTTAAQPVPSNAYSGMRWRLVGPFRAGRAIAAEGIPGNPYVFYFGSVDGGMWKTENAGVTWKSISEGLTNSSVGAIAIAPSQPTTIYVGTGEADIRSDITYGGGVFKSIDAGLHWHFAGLAGTRHIGRVLVDPKNPDLVLVAALGHAYGPNEERGVFRTTDGGKSWSKVLYKSPDVGAVDLGSDPSNPSVVYATLWEARRTPWSQYQPNEGPGSGLYKSTDEGITWTELSGNGLPEKPLGRIGVAVGSGSHGDIVYALVGAQDKGSGLYRSDDGGRNWRLTSKDPNIIARMWYFAGITVDPQNPDVVYIPNRSLMRSTDGGKTFPVIKGSPGGDDYHYLWVDPQNDRRMIVASDQGTSVSVDGGATWSSWYNQPTGQFYHVAVDDQFPYNIYGAQQDNGTASITSRSDYGQISFRDWHPIGAEESGYIAPDPLNPNIVYGGGPYGDVTRYDHTTGQTQIISPSVLASFGTPAPLRKYRFTWTSPIVFDKKDPHILYLGSQVLLETRDGGLSWKEISPDLTGTDANLTDRSGPPTIADASAKGWGVIYTIAPSPVQAGLIWAGTDDGLIQVTLDAGKQWSNVTPQGLPRWSKVSTIDASPFEAGAAYAAIDRHRLDDFTPWIYVTHDFGKHWRRADGGIDSLAYVQVVRADQKRKGLLYAGTETGVYVSFDDGGNWQSLQLNLPIASVRDLAVHDDDLIAATHGRAFWVLDDLSPLQQLNAESLSSDVSLFKPERTVRIRRSENRDTPLPPEEPLGTNPPAGAIIDYELKTAPSHPISLEILDEQGNLVRSYSSDDPPEPVSGPQYFMNDWLPKNHPLSSNVGHNRFVWDLRYAAPPGRGRDYNMAAIVGQGTEKEPQGPLVLPGTYRVRLTVNGKSYTQSLSVIIDPRVHTSSSVLKDQLSLAVQIWNTMADRVAWSESVDSVRHQLDALRRNPGTGARAQSLLASLEKTVGGVRESLGDGGLAGLESTVTGADREPTRQMREAYESLATKINAAEARWNAVVSSDLPELNKELKAHKIPEVTVNKLAPRHLKTGS